jgi:hypothetical protein
LMVSGVCRQYAVVNFKAAEALEATLLFTAVTAHLPGDVQQKHAQLPFLSLKSVFDHKPSMEWDAAEGTTVTFAVIPLYMIVLLNTERRDPAAADHMTIFQNVLADYAPYASDRNLWNQVMNITGRVLSRKINERELIEMGNNFGHHGRQNLQLLCVLSLIVVTSNNTERVRQMVNIFPYLEKVYSSSRAVIQFVLVPFLQTFLISIIKKEFVGQRSHNESIIAILENVEARERYAIRRLLQPVVTLMRLTFDTDRRRWLFEYADI